MEISDGIIFFIGLLLELTIPLVIWNCSVQRKIELAVLSVGTAVMIPAAIRILVSASFPSHAYLGFAGMFVFSRLIWRWWKEGVSPDNWRTTDVALAVLATISFSIASAALEQTA